MTTIVCWLLQSGTVQLPDFFFQEPMTIRGEGKGLASATNTEFRTGHIFFEH